MSLVLTLPVFPVNMPDPIRKRFGYGQLWPLRPACSQNRAGSYMRDPTSRMRFGPVLPKKAWIILCRTGPDPIWMAWTGFDQTHLVRKEVGVEESSGPVLAERNRPATSFLLSDSVALFHRRPGSDLDGLDRFWPNSSGPEGSRCARIIWPGSDRPQPARYKFPTFRLGCFLPQMAWVRLRNASLDLFWFWLSAFGQTDPVIKARWCARIIEPASGKHLGYGSDVNWIRHVYWEETSSVYGHIFWTPFCPRIFCD